MRANGPAPSFTRLITAWLSMTCQVISLACQRATHLAENGSERVHDAVMDLGSPPQPPPADGDELPVIEPYIFAAANIDRARLTLMAAANVMNDDPHGGLDAVTRERVHILFRELADVVMADALEKRITTAEMARGEIDDSMWVRKYRRIVAADGRWPPATWNTEEGHGEEGEA